VRGFVTTPLEQAISSADGIDYIESQSLLGVSMITARLKLNYDQTQALADITAKVNQVPQRLPPEAQVPAISVESADSQVAAAYLTFSSKILDQAEITDYLTRVVQPRLASVQGVQRADIIGARTFAMRIWLKPINWRAQHQPGPGPRRAGGEQLSGGRRQHQGFPRPGQSHGQHRPAFGR